MHPVSAFFTALPGIEFHQFFNQNAYFFYAFPLHDIGLQNYNPIPNT